LNEAYTADKLEAQLELQAKNFINDRNKNIINESSASLSKIFDWYQSDFTRSGGSVQDFINKYSSAKINKDTKVKYLTYNWALNE
jgi:malate synthase